VACGLLLLIALIGVASQVEASDGMRGDHCVVESTDTIVEDFYFFCRLLDVYGTIDGDLIGVAARSRCTRARWSPAICGWAAGG